MLRLWVIIAVLAVRGSTLSAQPSPAVGTAVFTLDAQRETLFDDPQNPVAKQFAAWVESCEMVPGGAVYVLECPPLESEDPQGGDSQEAIPVTVALFRDLNETIYLAGCPVLQGELAGPPRGREPRADKGVPPEDIRDCQDVAAGHTFTTEVGDSILQIVIRGRQLPFTIFEVHAKPRRISTPYVPKGSRWMPHVGPATTRKLEPMAPQTEASFTPPSTAHVSAGRPSRGSPSDRGVARTSLVTGRLSVRCSTNRALVLINGGYIGGCPIVMPLLAGRYEVTVVREGKDWVQQVEVEAGKTLRVTAGR